MMTITAMQKMMMTMKGVPNMGCYIDDDDNYCPAEVRLKVQASDMCLASECVYFAAPSPSPTKRNGKNQKKKKKGWIYHEENDQESGILTFFSFFFFCFSVLALALY